MLNWEGALRGAAATFCAAILGGCGIQGLQDQYTADVAVSENTNKQRLTMPGTMRTFDLIADCMPADMEGGVCRTPTMVKHFSGTTGSTVWRDRFQDYLLWRSDQQCERHKAGILSTQSVGNFALSTITTSASAVAAIVVAPAASILSAIAAISSGTKSAFNEDFYRQFVGPAVVRRINADRVDMRLLIQARRGAPLVKTTSKPISERGFAPGVTSASSVADSDDAKAKSVEAAKKAIAATEAANDVKKMDEVAKNAKAALDAEKDEEKKKPLKDLYDKADAAAKAAQSASKTASEEAKQAKEAETKAKAKSDGNYVTRTYTVRQENQYEPDFTGTRRDVPFAIYTIEAAIQDVELYHQMCSFVSGLASLIQPGTKFEDTELGIKQRIATLTAQLERNNETTKTLGVTSEASRNLLQVNADISRQIMVLQQRMGTAPTSTRTD